MVLDCQEYPFAFLIQGTARLVKDGINKLRGKNGI